MRLTRRSPGFWLPECDPSIALAQAVRRELELPVIAAALGRRLTASARVIAAAILFAASGSIAVANDEPVYLAGVGTMTCAQFNERVRRDPELAETVQFIWAQGYMSASNVWRMLFNERLRNLDAWPESEQRAHLRQFCEQRPDAAFGAAVQDLYAALPFAPTPAQLPDQRQLGRR
jgi:hypothetical protein